MISLLFVVFLLCVDHAICCSCGTKPPTRIIGGSETTPNEFPWHALLKRRGGSFFCGGSLISENWVITAAHCVYIQHHSFIIVTLGEHDRAEDDPISSDYSVTQKIMHPDYNPTTIDNDIAVLKLNTSVPITNNIMPICLPFEKRSSPPELSMVTVTGWGTTETGLLSTVLKKIDMLYISTALCRLHIFYLFSLTDNMFCGYTLFGDSCSGDSGGPLMWESESKNYLMGLVSWGYGCNTFLFPGVYVKVTNYLDWIADNTQEQFCIP